MVQDRPFEVLSRTWDCRQFQPSYILVGTNNEEAATAEQLAVLPAAQAVHPESARLAFPEAQEAPSLLEEVQMTLALS